MLVRNVHALAGGNFGPSGPFDLERPRPRDLRAQVGHQPVEGALVRHDPASSAGSRVGRGLGAGSASIATLGSLRSSHPGRTHVVRPSSCRTAGRSSNLITIASRNTAVAIASPNISSTRLPLIANAPNTATITAAAAVITRPVRARPSLLA